jgi:mono/diheme cytochrome c family protein
MRLTLLNSLVFMACVACGGDGTTATDSPVATDSSASTESQSGEELYLYRCSGCHGEDGGGTAAGPNIRNELGKSDEALIRVILEGEDDMDPVNVTEEEAQLIVDYMREAWQ